MFSKDSWWTILFLVISTSCVEFQIRNPTFLGNALYPCHIICFSLWQIRFIRIHWNKCIFEDNILRWLRKRSAWVHYERGWGTHNPMVSVFRLKAVFIYSCKPSCVALLNTSFPKKIISFYEKPGFFFFICCRWGSGRGSTFSTNWTWQHLLRMQETATSYFFWYLLHIHVNPWTRVIMKLQSQISFQAMSYIR